MQTEATAFSDEEMLATPLCRATGLTIGEIVGQEDPTLGCPHRYCAARSEENLFLGAYEGDSVAHQKAVLEFVRRQITANLPIYPNRALGFEYAAINTSPRGIPIAEVAISNLRPGERVPWNRQWWQVVAISRARLTLKNPAGQVERIAPDRDKWQAFVRDIDGQLLAAAHGADAGDLLTAWRRDPIAGAPLANP